jgi:hypothetical protein
MPRLRLLTYYQRFSAIGPYEQLVGCKFINANSPKPATKFLFNQMQTYTRRLVLANMMQLACMAGLTSWQRHTARHGHYTGKARAKLDTRVAPRQSCPKRDTEQLTCTRSRVTLPCHCMFDT